jgi:mannose/cellobiose epimerase-like protein (N-acyl-D-glucosamine 2-epimerase family)
MVETAADAAGDMFDPSDIVERLARLERHYLGRPAAGGWYDQFDRDGKSLVPTIGARSFVHVFCAVTEAEHARA